MLALFSATVLALLGAGPDARQILLASAEAARVVSSVACDAIHTYTIADQDQYTDRARTTFERLPADKAIGGRVRIDFGHPETIVSYAYDGGQLRMASHESRVITTRRPGDNPASPIANSIQGKIITDNPILRYGRLSRAAHPGNSVTEAGTAEVAGVLCTIVRVAYPDSDEVVDRQDTYYIARSDRLPRRADMRFRFPDRDTHDEHSLILSNLQLEPALDESVFSLPAPDGYTEEVFTREPPPEPLPLGSPAPDFRHVDPNGRQHVLADYRGRWLLLDFWGTWCGPCLKALPALQAIHEEFKDVAIVGLSCHEPARADPAAVFRQKNLTYSLLLEGGITASAYRVTAFPTVILIDPRGVVVDRLIGSEADLAAQLRTMLHKHQGQWRH
jgi:thiol-disulfide isomerase/thioredoxin